MAYTGTIRRASSWPKWKWIAAAAAVPILIATWHFLPLQDWLKALEERIHGMGSPGAILYAGMLVVAALVFVPGSVLGLGGGYLFGFAAGMAVVWAGEIAAAAMGFVIARYLARRAVEKLASRRPTLGAIDAAIGRNGWKMVGLLRVAAIVPFSLSNYLFGLSSVDFLPYMAVTAVGTLPGALFYVYLGAAGKTLAETKHLGPWQWVVLAAGLLASAVTTVILTRFAKKELKRPASPSHASPRPGAKKSV